MTVFDFICKKGLNIQCLSVAMARQKSVSGAWYSVPTEVSRGVFFDKRFLVRFFGDCKK